MKDKELTEKAQSLLKSMGLVWLETELSGTMDKIKLVIKKTEKQKLEFAIEQLKKIKIAVSDKNPFTVYNIAHQIQELEQKLSEL